MKKKTVQRKTRQTKRVVTASKKTGKVTKKVASRKSTPKSASPKKTMTKAQIMKERYKIPYASVTEELILDMFDEQIRKMASKYGFMAMYAVGGTYEDLRSALAIRTIETFRDWQKRVKKDRTYRKRTALDAVKYISCRLRTFCIDLARYQKSHIEPGKWQLFDFVTAVDGEDREAGFLHREDLLSDDEELTNWNASLNPLQKKLVSIWRHENFDGRQNPMKSLVREAVKQLGEDEETVKSALLNLPRL